MTKDKTSNNDKSIPYNQRYGLSLNEASIYFGIGKTRLKEILSNDNEAKYMFKNGNKIIVKRQEFENYLTQQYFV